MKLAAAERRHAIAIAVLLGAAALTLRSLGQRWWCKQGDLLPWAFDVWSPHNSQHLIDPYTLSHLLHGVVFYGLFWLIVRNRASLWTRLVLALGLETAWEVLENTPMVIQKYRESTMSLDYSGDTVLNSLSDVAACAVGFALTAAIPAWGSVLGFVGIELLMLATIRDSLLVNVIMLLHPIEAIKTWQMAGMPGPS